MEDKLLKKVKPMPRRGTGEPATRQVEPDEGEKRQPSRQYGTVGYLMEQYLQSETTAAQPGAEVEKTFERNADNLLNTTWPRYELPFAITRLPDAPHGLRQDTPEDIRIAYRVYTPPGHWGIHRYAILRCTVQQKEGAPPDKFMSHAGEELLYSEQKGLKYCFFDPASQSKDIPFNIKPGAIHRIRPEFPHNNFYTVDEVDCWMILRPLSGTYMTETIPASPEEEIQSEPPPASTSGRRKRAASDDEGEDSESTTPKKSRLFVGRTDLQGFSTYAMCALGLRDKIRVARLCAGLSINQVAHRTSLNPSYLGRLEDGTANISFANLARLAHLLGIDLTNLKDQLRVKPFFESYADVDDYTHWLHPHRWDLRDGKRLELRFQSATEPSGQSIEPPEEPGGRSLMGDCSSWIVTKGEVVFRYTPVNGDRPWKEILAQDDVVHLRSVAQHRHVMSFTPIDDSCLLEIRYSSRCSCGQALHELNRPGFTGGSNE